MTQKDKVKELVGRGLHSYHTKSLQQIDRIEKKNKEQNHKISILSNELDNDYLTKTEEGSVISLEHSKEGMIYLDELQGNTLVNYCTDGSKELILNGDIDLEGTFVTTTEGVDNGKVDVMCEGNTMINIYPKFQTRSLLDGVEITDNEIRISDAEGHRQYYNTISSGQLKLVKPSTLYTVVATIKKNTLSSSFAIINSYSGVGGDLSSKSVTIPSGTVGLIKKTFTTVDDFTNRNRLGFIVSNGITGELIMENGFIILEGDWTNKEIPPYFEGMKSVGQDDENGHKIEILSQNKNLWNAEIVKKQDGRKPSYTKNNNIITYSEIGEYGIYVPIKVKKDETLRISGIVKNVQNIRIFKESDNFKGMGIYNRDFNGIETEVSPHYICTFPEDGVYHIRVWCKSTGTPILTDFLAEISSVNTTYVEHKSNKKEILLNEPLVGNDTVKDRVVKIGGKLFIERFWETVTLDGTQEIVKGNWDVPIFSYYIPNTEGEPTDFPKTLICDRITPKSFNLNDDTHWALYTGKDSVESQRYIRMQIPASIISKDDLEGFKTWLRNNPITIAYRLNAPIYEPLEVEPILNTYNDVTHISNNSIIPCNMKIQNSGYNAIIKPSTLYTVALDTDKSGTIGMNLGGAKGTTTNNVLTLTTPATLTDDSLRIYGKGIKGSKVRLLEGDKTNWIPSFFEGMKSSFEDKFDVTDNTYKMEILSNNENLFDLQRLIPKSNNNTFELIENGFIMTVPSGTMHSRVDYKLQNLNKNKTYRLSYKVEVLEYKEGANINNDYIGYCTGCKYYPLKSNNYTSDIVLSNTLLGFHNSNLDGITKVKFYDIQIKEVGCSTVNNFTPYKSNKIQFSSIEPLRSVEVSKDGFVFKDGKLMIERNCGTLTLNSSQGFIRANKYDNGHLYGFEKDFTEIKPVFQNTKAIKCDKYVYYPYSGDSSMRNKKEEWVGTWSNNLDRFVIMLRLKTKENTLSSLNEYLNENPISVMYIKKEPTYEEIPFELQKIILEGYENGTLFFDTNIPPTSTVTYAGETPIVKSVRLNKTEVLSNTTDINDNIIPYLMDMDYRVVCLELATETQGISMARLFGGVYEMLKRDILSNRYSVDEYRHRLDAYLSANKITEDEYNKLGDMLNE